MSPTNSVETISLQSDSNTLLLGTPSWVIVARDSCNTHDEQTAKSKWVEAYQVAVILLILSLLVLGHECEHEGLHRIVVHRNINHNFILWSANDAVQSTQQVVSFVHLKWVLSTCVICSHPSNYLQSKLCTNAVCSASAMSDKASLTFFDQECVRGLSNFSELLLERGTISLGPAMLSLLTRLVLVVLQ